MDIRPAGCAGLKPPRYKTTPAEAGWKCVASR
jgi:hypothetical protein